MKIIIIIIKLRIRIIFVLNVKNRVIGVKAVLLKYKLASDVRNKGIMQMIVKKIGKKNEFILFNSNAEDR